MHVVGAKQIRPLHTVVLAPNVKCSPLGIDIAPARFEQFLCVFVYLLCVCVQIQDVYTQLVRMHLFCKERQFMHQYFVPMLFGGCAFPLQFPELIRI